MTTHEFFYNHPIFRLEQFYQFKLSSGSLDRKYVSQALQYYIGKGRIVSIRRGLFAVVPPNQSLSDFFVDPYLLAGAVAEDSILSHHTALELYGVAYSIFQRFTFKTEHKIKPFNFQGQLFQPVKHDLYFKKNLHKENYTTTIYRNGLAIKATNLEATYVDALDRPDLCGGWEEVYRSLNSISVLSIKDVINYCLKLNSPILCAKVGYFLEQRKGIFEVSQEDLQMLIPYRPKSPYYFDRAHLKSCHYIKKWNLMIPKDHINNKWEEPDYAF